MNKAKQYFDDLFQRATALKEKYNEIDKNSATDPQSNFIKNEAHFSFSLVEDKYINFYKCLVNRIPEDKKPEVNEYLKKLYFKSAFIEKAFKTKYAKELKTIK